MAPKRARETLYGECTKPVFDSILDITNAVLKVVSDIINNHGLPDSVYKEIEDYLTKKRTAIKDELDNYCGDDPYKPVRDYYQECLVKLDELREVPSKKQKAPKSVRWADPIMVVCA